MLAHLLHLEGIDSVVIEDRSRDYVEARIRAGVLEQGIADLLVEAGVGERMQREGVVHHGIQLQFDGERHRIPLQRADRQGVRDLRADGDRQGPDRCAARHGPAARCSRSPRFPSRSSTPTARGSGSTTRASARELECDVIAGCDGFHGVCRPSIPAGVLTEFSREYPFGWLGILAAVAPSIDEVVYSAHERGFGLLSLRTPELSRYYIQCTPDDDAERWADEQIWAELQERFRLEDWNLSEGPVLEKGVTGMRSYVVEPMQYGRLFLAGDAAHIVPPTGAKGLNLAIRDVRLLAEAVADFYRSGDDAALASYSERCLRRVWRAEHFSWWMTTMLHRPPDENPFDWRLRLSQLRYVTTSEAAARSLAENYVGLEVV